MAKDLRFDVSALDRASATFVKMAAAVERFERKLDQLDNKKVDVEVDVDTKKADAQVGAFAANLQRKVKAAIDSLPELKITADSSDADRALADVRRRMAELSDKRIGIDIGAEEALAETRALRRELDTLARTSPDIRVRTDAAAALAQLAAIDREVDKLDGKTANIKVKADKSFSDASVNIALLGRSLAQLAIPIGIVGAAPAIASIGQSAKVASGALLLIPAAMTGAGLAAATLKVAFKGFGDAISANAKKSAKGMKELTPAAQEAANAIRGLHPAWQELKTDVQSQMFDGVAEKIRSLGGTYMPILRDAMTDVAQAFNYSGVQVATFLQQASTVDSVRTMFSNLGDTIENVVAKSAAPLVAAFVDMGTVGSGVLLDLTSGAGRAAQSFGMFIAQARQSGQLEVWMRQGVEVLRQLGQVAINTGAILSSIFKAADGAGKPFLTTLVEITAKMREWTASAQGQSAITSAFESIRGVVTALLPGIQAIGRAIGEIVVNREASGALEALASAFSALVVAAAPVVVTISGMVSRAITPLANALSFLAPVIGPVVGGLLAMKAASSAMSFAAAITGLSSMKAAATGAVGALDRIRGSAATTGAAVAATGTAASGAGAAMRNAASGMAATDGATRNAGKSAGDAGGKFDGLRSKMDGLKSAGSTLAAGLPLIGAALTGLVAAAGAGRASFTDMQTAIAAGGPALDQFRQKLIEQGDGLQDSTNWLGQATHAVDEWLNENITGIPTLTALDRAVAENNARMAEQAAKLGVAGAAFAEMRGHTDAAAASSRNFSDGLQLIAPAMAGIKNGVVPTHEMQSALDGLGRSAGDAAVQSGVAAAQLGGVDAGAKAAATSMQQSRNDFVAAAQAAGMTAAEANRLADSIGLIPSQAEVNFKTNAATARMEIDQVNQKIQAVPAGKSVTVNAMTDQAKASLTAMGFQVTTLPNGQVEVIAKTDAAKRDLELLNSAARRPENKDINLNTLDAHTKARVLSTEASKPENKPVDLATGAANIANAALVGSIAAPANKPVGADTGGAMGAVGALTGAIAVPGVKPVSAEAGGARATIAGVHGEAQAPATMPVGADTAAGHAATNALHTNALTQSTMPVPANTAAGTGSVNTLHSNAERTSTMPVPANTAPGTGSVNTLHGNAERQSTMPVRAETGGAMGAVASLFAAASRTATMVVNVVKRFFGAEGGIVPGQGFAEGGISSRITHRQVIPFAGGGSYDPKQYDGRRLTPMSATQPRIVSPNTWRVIGDRATDDEAFIPLVPGSASSQALLGEAARRMGFALTPASAGMAVGGVGGAPAVSGGAGGAPANAGADPVTRMLSFVATSAQQLANTILATTGRTVATDTAVVATTNQLGATVGTNSATVAAATAQHVAGTERTVSALFTDAASSDRAAGATGVQTSATYGLTGATQGNIGASNALGGTMNNAAGTIANAARVVHQAAATAQAAAARAEGAAARAVAVRAAAPPHDDSFASNSYYSPNRGKPGAIQAEDGSWVMPSFYRARGDIVRAGTPTVVSPGRLRAVMGDARVDESYIPHDGSARSLALLGATAKAMPGGLNLARQLAGLRTGSAAQPIVIRTGMDVAELRSIVSAIQGLRGDLHLSGQYAPQMVDELRGLGDRLLSSVSATARAAVNRDLSAIGAWG